MMKLKLCTLIVLLITAAGLVLLSGCTPNEADAPAAETTERVTVYGEISEIVGNMVSIEVIEMPTPREMTEEELAAMRERAGADGFTSREITEEEREEIMERFANAGPQLSYGTVPEGGGPVRGDRGENAGPFTDMSEMTEEEIEAMRERFMEAYPGFQEGMPGMQIGMGRMYTGETKDLIIPAGAPVFERSYADGEQAETEITLDKLKTGDVIEATYASDNETVAKVVKQAANMRPMDGRGAFSIDGQAAFGQPVMGGPVGGAFIGQPIQITGGN